MDRLKHLFVALFLVNFSCSFGQLRAEATNSENLLSVNETLFVHTNASTFVSGETLLYKMYCINTSNFTTSEVSKIAYLQLIDSNKKVVFKHKLFLENGVAESDFFITPNLSSGNYKLIAYTNWMLNFSTNSFQMDLIIINPFQVDSKNNKNIQAIYENPNKITSENNEVILRLNKESYDKREKVVLNLKDNSLEFLNGNYSISVRKKQDLPSSESYNAINFSKTFVKNTTATKSELILPELRGELISGKIIAKKSLNSVANKYVSLSIAGESFLFKTVKTNTDGIFIFNIDKKYKNTEFVFQILDDNRLEYSISIDDKYEFDTSKVSFLPKFSINESLKTSLQERSVASQVENAYFEKKQDSLAKSTSILPFYNLVGKEYILDNFTRFSTIEETITEILKEVHFEKKRKKYSIYLVDYDPNTDLKENSLVLIDGLILQDLNELFLYKTSNIYKVIVYNKGYFYQGKLYNGFVSFITKNYDYVNSIKGDYLLQTKIQIPQQKKVYFKQVYDGNTTNNRIPDYRYQLLWIPNYFISTDENILDFYTSDISGTFEIVLEGFSTNGKPISVTKNFEVK